MMKKEPEYRMRFSSYEYRQLCRGLMEARNARIRDGKPTAPLDELLVKVQEAPTKGRSYAR